MKTNKKFMILSAIGIIMVVDAHSWTSLKLGTHLFPYNSFFMGMFLFISGYFYNVQQAITQPVSFLYKKFKTLFLPYLFWFFVYLVLSNLLTIFGFKYAPKFSITNYLIEPFINGERSGLNSPAYYIPILFYILIVYTLLRKMCKTIWNDFLFMLIFALMGAIVVAYSVYIQSKHQYSSPLMMLLKICFSIQFFQLGVLFKKYLEKYFNRINPFIILLTSVFAISIVKHIFTKYVYHLNRLDFGPEFLKLGIIGYFLPLITTILGTSFWLVISELLEPGLKDNKIINFISNNTFGILMHHIFFSNLVNWGLLIIHKLSPIKHFNSQSAISSSWYRFHINNTTDFYIVYFIIGLLGACIMCYIVNKFTNYLKNLFILRKQ